MSIMNEKIEKIARSPKHRGAIFQDEADEKGMVLLQAKIRSLKLYLLIDPEANTVEQARFFTYGGLIYTALAEIHCRLIEGAPIAEAFSVSATRIEASLREAEDSVALAEDAEELSHIKEFNEIFRKEYPDKQKAALIVRDLRAKQAANGTPEYEIRKVEDQVWVEASDEERRDMLEKALDEHIRKGLNMDGGDAVILDIQKPAKVIIEYQGACSSCGAAGGSTLFFIEDTLRRYVYSGLTVEPASTGENTGLF